MMASPSTPTIDPFTLYNVPSGFIGLINDLICIYIFTCLLSGRTPLQPKRKLQNQHRTTAILYLSFAAMEILNFLIFRSLENLNGPWQELYCIMAAKVGMMPFCGVMVTTVAVRELKTQGRAKAAGLGKRVVKEGGLEARGVQGENTNDRYQDVTAKIFDDSRASKASELSDLPRKYDSTADTKEIKEVGIKLLGLAMEAQREGPPRYTAGTQLDTEDLSADLESQKNNIRDASSDQAREHLLPGEENASEVHAQDHYSYPSGLFIILMAVLSIIPAGFLWAQISMAIQSIKLGNRDTLVVGFVFLVLFFAGVVPYAFAIAYTAMRRAKLAPGRVLKVENLLAPTILVSCLLAILYGDMNIGAIGGNLAGMGSITDRNAMMRYWLYLLSSMLPLFCH